MQQQACRGSASGSERKVIVSGSVSDAVGSLGSLRHSDCRELQGVNAAWSVQLGYCKHWPLPVLVSPSLS